MCAVRVLMWLAMVGACASALAVSGASEVNPIRKVTGMLTDMQKELEKEKENEGALFEKAMCACETGEKDLQKVIDDSTAAIAQLTSTLEEETSGKSQLDQALKEHYSSKDQATADLEKATTIRTKEAAEFSSTDKTGKANLKGLDGAIAQLSGGASSASLMQQDDSPKLRRMLEVTRYLTADKREEVLNFLDEGLGEGTGQPTAPVAEIVGVLKGLHDEMSKDLESATSTEKAAALGYGELKSAKQQEIKAATEAIISKEKRAGTLAVSISNNKDALEDAQEELSNAQKYLKDLTTSCANKGKERDTRAKMRDAEIAAISEAIKILTDDDALEIFKKAVPSASLLAQKRKTFDAFLQTNGVASRASRASNGLARAEAVVERLAKKHPTAPYHMLLMALKGGIQSAILQPGGTAEYAGQAAGVVTKMVDDMVHVLHDEDVEDEHKKDFCANETEKVTQLQTEKQDLVESLSASIEEMTDGVAALTSEIKAVNEEINANDKEVHETTELRQKQHQEFTDSFSTLDTARRLIDKAALRLHKFYNPEMVAKKVEKVKTDAVKEAGLAFGGLQVKPRKTLAVQRMEASFGDDSLVQKKSVTHSHAHGKKVAPPVLPETPTTYEKKESGGVLGLMNDMKEELTADMREAETEEKFAAKDYVRVMAEAKEMRAGLVKSLHQKESAKAELQTKLEDAKNLRQMTLKELQNIALYMAQLHTECDFLMRNYDVRHDGRVEEESGLEDAKTIVTHEDPPEIGVIKAGYDQEHSEKQVEAHFPEEGGHVHAEVGTE